MAVMAKICLMVLLYMSGGIVANAQIPGPGVDPNAIMLDDFESGTHAKWTPRPGSRGEKVSFEMMKASSGDLVRFGEYALKVNIDFTGAQAQQTLTAQLSPVDRAIPGNASGGKKFGMWVYATAGVEGMWFRISTRPAGATSGVTNTDLSAKINWTGWKYVQCDLPAGHEFHPDGIRFLVLKGYPNYYANGYVIIDNIRVINKSFTEDLVAPSISSFTGNGTSLSGTYTTNLIDLLAKFSDGGNPPSGINYSRINMIVDGYAYKTGDAGFEINQTENTVSLKGVSLSNGTHNAIAHVEDNFGHITERTGTFTIEAPVGETTTVTAEPVAQAHVGNPFEMKINTNNSKNIKELELVIEFNNIGSVDATNSVTFAPSAQAGSSYTFNANNGNLTINLKNDISAEAVETLATINVSISKNSNPTDVLRCSPVSAKATYADGSSSLFSLFTAFTRDVIAAYDYKVNKRIVGAPGEVFVSDFSGTPQSGATVFALNEAKTSVIASAVTNAEGIASGMNFADVAQAVNIYAEKDGKYSYTRLIRTLNPLLTQDPTYIKAGITADPMTSKTITWISNPIQAAEPSIMKLAKKSDGESAFKEFIGTTKTIEYNAVVSNGIAKGSSVTVTDLEPGTTYIYKVGDGNIWSATNEFTTTTSTKKFSFNAFGDLQASSNGEMNRFLAAAKTIEEMPERSLFNLNVGDIVDNDDRFDFYSYCGYLYNQRPGFANIDMVAAYGNHEYMGNADADNIKFFNGHHTVAPSDKYDAKVVGTGSYAVEYENMIVIALDWAHKGGATVNAIHAEQAKWLEDILSKTDKTWKVVTLHYPIFPNESTPGTKGIFGPIFDKYNVQLVFCGHGHTFERVQVYKGEYLMPLSDKRTFTPVIGGTLHFQLGDMTGTGGNGRWINCAVDGKKMDFTVRDANNNIVEKECFTLYASAINNCAVNFNTVNAEGTLSATVDGSEIASGAEVTEGKDIVFTATSNSGYKVKEWKLNGNVVSENENTYTLSDLAEASTVTVEFDLLVGIDNAFDSNFNIYPNPFVNVLNVAGAENSTLQIMDIAGVVVHSQKITDTDESIILEKLQSGMYFVQIEKEGQVKTVKVLKK